jgi:TRAP-type C4-dicarboxylate transport system substrate-binding protein
MKRLNVMCFMILFAFLATGVIATVGFAQEQAITLKVSNWFPSGHRQDTLLKQWGEDLEKRTGGKVKVNYYAAGTLVPAAQSYDAVVKGIADVSNHVLGYTMGLFPFSQVLDLPIGMPPGPAATKIANDMYNKFKPKEFDAVKILWFHGQPGAMLHTKTKPVASLEDLKGLKIRSFGSNAKFLGLLGAAPVAMPMTEVYDALSKGVVDGLLSAWEALEGWKTGEHIKYSTLNTSTAYSATFLVMMNKQKFDSLPADIKKTIDKMSKEYMEKFATMWTEADQSGINWLKGRGDQFIPLSKKENDRWYNTGAKPLVDQYIKDMKEKGLPGDKAVKFLLSSFKKYQRK